MAAGVVSSGCSDFRLSGGGSDKAAATDTRPADMRPAGKPGDAAANAGVAGRTSLIPQSRPPIADLPVPIGFVIAESVSRNYESAGTRYVDHTYQGRADKFDVERFVRQNLTGKGWRLRSSQMVRGDFELKYEKDNELLDVTIRGEDRPILGQSTSLRYNLQTAGRQ